MFDKLEALERRFIDIDDSLSQSDLDAKELMRLTKERAGLEAVVMAFRGLKELKQERSDLNEILNDPDPEVRSLAKADGERLALGIKELEEKLIVLMLPKDPMDGNVIMEIRAGTEDRRYFFADLLRMYADTPNGAVGELSASFTESTKGGFKEVVVMISGNGIFSRLKFEKGVHRVQRVPATESQGRLHTVLVPLRS